MRCAWSRKREEGEEKGWKSGGLFFTFIIKTFRLLLFLSPFSLSLTLSLFTLSRHSLLSLSHLSLSHSLSLSLFPLSRHSLLKKNILQHPTHRHQRLPHRRRRPARRRVGHADAGVDRERGCQIRASRPRLQSDGVRPQRPKRRRRWRWRRGCRFRCWRTLKKKTSLFFLINCFDPSRDKKRLFFIQC